MTTLLSSIPLRPKGSAAFAFLADDSGNPKPKSALHENWAAEPSLFWVM